MNDGSIFCKSGGGSGDVQCANWKDGKCTLSGACGGQRIHPDIPSMKQISDMLQEQAEDKIMNMDRDQFMIYWVDMLTKYLDYHSVKSNAQSCLNELFEAILGKDYYIVDPVNNVQANIIMLQDALTKLNGFHKFKVDAMPCPMCNGSGHIYRTSETSSSSSICEFCKGTGIVQK